VKIVFSPHAVDRMLQRDLSATEIESVIQEHDGKIKQSKDKFIYYKTIKGRKDNLVAVVAVKDGQTYEVITTLVNFEVQNEL
jgi:hypothetical protein